MRTPSHKWPECATFTAVQLWKTHSKCTAVIHPWVYGGAKDDVCPLLSIVVHCCPLLSIVVDCCQPPPTSDMIYFTID